MPATASTADMTVGRLRGASVLLPPSPHPIQPDALLEHAHAQALLKTTRLTGLSPALVDLAVVGRRTGVLDVAWRVI